MQLEGEFNNPEINLATDYLNMLMLDPRGRIWVGRRIRELYYQIYGKVKILLLLLLLEAWNRFILADPKNVILSRGAPEVVN